MQRKIAAGHSPAGKEDFHWSPDAETPRFIGDMAAPRGDDRYLDRTTIPDGDALASSVFNEFSSRQKMSSSSVFVFGMSSNSTNLLEQIRSLLTYLHNECGPLLGVFRFPFAAPKGVLRPDYNSVVLLAVFQSNAGAASAVRQGKDFVTGLKSQISVKPATLFRVPDSAAEDCLRTFLPIEQNITQETSSLEFAPSARLWTLLFSPLSPYAVNWRQASDSALRGDAIVIDESQVLLLPPIKKLDETHNYLSSDVVDASLPMAAQTNGIQHLSSSERRCGSLQDQYFAEKYQGGLYSRRTGDGIVERGLKAVTTMLGGSTHEPPEIRPFAVFPAPLGCSSVYGTEGDAPPTSRRRVESTEPNDSIPRLNSLGSALAWIPGFDHIMPLFRVGGVVAHTAEAMSLPTSTTANAVPLTLNEKTLTHKFQTQQGNPAGATAVKQRNPVATAFLNTLSGLISSTRSHAKLPAKRQREPDGIQTVSPQEALRQPTAASETPRLGGHAGQSDRRPRLSDQIRVLNISDAQGRSLLDSRGRPLPLRSHRKRSVGFDLPPLQDRSLR